MRPHPITSLRQNGLPTSFRRCHLLRGIFLVPRLIVSKGVIWLKSPKSNSPTLAANYAQATGRGGLLITVKILAQARLPTATCQFTSTIILIFCASLAGRNQIRQRGNHFCTEPIWWRRVGAWDGLCPV